jgi:hypothetical protein
MSEPLPALAPLPWYRHFWPWFVLGLLGTSIVGSLTTVYIAVSGRDPEVRDTWSSDAKAITRNDAAERFAEAIGLEASIVSTTDPALAVTLSGPHPVSPDRIVVHLVHPTLEERDLDVTLERGPDGVYRATLPVPVAGRFQLSVEGDATAASPGSSADWRLGARVELVPGLAVVLGHPPPTAPQGSARTDAG